jgi:ADP-L-glycero-D-manno-heptose 6-epimerase
MKPKYLITGGHGFIGSNLIIALKRYGIPDKNIFILNQDLKEPIHFKKKVDVVYHLAALTDTRYKDDIGMFNSNILLFLNALKYTLDCNAKFIYASSASMYGKYEKTAYAESKRVIDEIAPFFDRWIGVVGLRFFNVFGPNELRKGKMASMISQWAVQIVKGQRPIIFDGNVKRDHIYVKDAVKALLMAQYKENGLYDVGTGIGTSWRKVLNLVLKTMDSNLKPKYIKNPYKGRYQKDTKANVNWGFQPDYTLKEGIEDYLINNNEDIYRYSKIR